MDSEQVEQRQFWTVQQFWTTPAGKPWYALQLQGDEGVKWQLTGYRHEVDQFAAKHGIQAVELPAISEQEFTRRMLGRMPDELTIGRDRSGEKAGELERKFEQKHDARALFWQLPEPAQTVAPATNSERAKEHQQQQNREGFGFSF